MDAQREIIRDLVATGDVGGLHRLIASEGATTVKMDDDPNELTSLHIAAARGHLEMVEFLLSSTVGADPRAARINNFTPLHSAAMTGHAKICETLLKLGAKVNFQTVPQGYAALHSAAFAGHLEVIRVLLSFGADRSVRNYRNERPSETAKRRGETTAERLLE